MNEDFSAYHRLLVVWYAILVGLSKVNKPRQVFNKTLAVLFNLIYFDFYCFVISKREENLIYRLKNQERNKEPTKNTLKLLTLSISIYLKTPRGTQYFSTI
jgi:hypothetical protein